ncbi:MAG: hypothetical protein KC912_11495 [Proteobacteria bacterium]|nr:hypothetical protein [Pseudomonadota bacterium]
MSKRSTLSYSSDASLLATADAQEVLVYGGRSDAGVWRDDVGEPVRFVRFAEKHLLAVTTKGSLLIFDRKSGKRLHEGALGKTPKAFVAWGEDHWAMVVSKGVQLGKGVSAGSFVSVDKPLLLAVDGDGRVAVATKTGQVALIEDGAIIASHDLDETLSGLCAHPEGGWFASGQHVIHRLGPDLASSRAVAKASDGKISGVVAAGPLIAFRLDSDWVAITSWGDGQPRGAWKYASEQVGELIFHPDGRNLACSVGHGDANVVDLTSGDVRRTDPHPGRKTYRWGLQVGVDSEDIVAVLEGGSPEYEYEDEDEELTTGELIGCLVFGLVALVGLGVCGMATMAVLFS